MKTIKINLKKHSYSILIGNKIINLLGRYINKLGIGSTAYIITNARIKHKYGSVLTRALGRFNFGLKFKLVADTEKSKSIMAMSSIIGDIARFDKKRRIFIVAFGGGVIGDLAGFVASVYKRGIAYLQVPTTLLAQVDSSIGGKTAVDLSEGKNLVGAFYQPKLVLSDLAFLMSLDLRQLASGLAEVIKYGIIKDEPLFVYLEKKYQDILAHNLRALEYIVWRSSYIKAKIVEKDEREEKRIRTVLNFGHTLGHAIEASGGYKKYNHGEAVALGMLLACDISRVLGLLKAETSLRIEGLIKAVGLPLKAKGVALSGIIKAYYRDKKFIGLKNRFVLLEDIGVTRIVENVPLQVIKEALKNRVF